VNLARTFDYLNGSLGELVPLGEIAARVFELVETAILAAILAPSPLFDRAARIETHVQWTLPLDGSATAFSCWSDLLANGDLNWIATSSGASLMTFCTMCIFEASIEM
jgi:hypothetical protein